MILTNMIVLQGHNMERDTVPDCYYLTLQFGDFSFTTTINEDDSGPEVSAALRQLADSIDMGIESVLN